MASKRRILCLIPWFPLLVPNNYMQMYIYANLQTKDNPVKASHGRLLYVMKSTFAKVTCSIPAEVPMLSAIDALSSAKCCRNSFIVGALKVKVIRNLVSCYLLELNPQCSYPMAPEKSKLNLIMSFMEFCMQWQVSSETCGYRLMIHKRAP